MHLYVAYALRAETFHDPHDLPDVICHLPTAVVVVDLLVKRRWWSLGPEPFVYQRVSVYRARELNPDEGFPPAVFKTAASAISPARPADSMGRCGPRSDPFP